MSGAPFALRGHLALRRGQGLPRTPFLASGIFPPLRSGQISLDEAEQSPARSSCQRRDAPMVFGIIPECRSASLRNERSASPESPPKVRGPTRCSDSPGLMGRASRHYTIAGFGFFFRLWDARTASRTFTDTTHNYFAATTKDGRNAVQFLADDSVVRLVACIYYLKP